MVRSWESGALPPNPRLAVGLGETFAKVFPKVAVISDLAKGRKSMKVAGGARASGYSIVLASKILRFQAPRSPIP